MRLALVTRGRAPLLALAGVLVIATAAAVAYATRPSGPAHGWRLAWHDEFDGRAVDTSNWTVLDHTYLPYEHSILTAHAGNVRVGDGVLTVEARRERRTVGAVTRDVTSGYLDTIGKHSWRYGRFEIRAQLPTAEGMWPAFWLRADHGPGEIDVMEAVGGIPRLVQQSVIRDTNDGREKQVHRYYLPTGTVAGWHVYGAVVRPNAVAFFVDGRRVYRVSAAQVPWLRDSFDEPLNIRLNLQVGGSLPDYFGHPLDGATRFPATYRIDWVRVYQYR